MKHIFMAMLMEVLQFLTSSDFIDAVQVLVLKVDKDENKTSSEKKQEVISTLEREGFNFAGHLVNLVIEGIVAQKKIAKK